MVHFFLMFHYSMFVGKFIRVSVPKFSILPRLQINHTSNNCHSKQRYARYSEKHDSIICWIHLSISVCIEPYHVTDRLPSDVKKITTEENLD